MYFASFGFLNILKIRFPLQRNLIAQYLYKFNHIIIDVISAASFNLIHLFPRRTDGQTDGQGHPSRPLGSKTCLTAPLNPKDDWQVLVVFT